MGSTPSLVEKLNQEAEEDDIGLHRVSREAFCYFRSVQLCVCSEGAGKKEGLAGLVELLAGVNSSPTFYSLRS